ncbi:MAG: hypothetical protein GQ538_10545 [Xanthomonadales bacterium]|nr:hypothetical protein [Xanthomonadales bacterium]
MSYGTSLDVDSSGQSMAPSSKVESVEEVGSNDAARHQRRGLKLGLLLFRRG